MTIFILIALAIAVVAAFLLSGPHDFTSYSHEPPDSDGGEE